MAKLTTAGRLLFRKWITREMVQIEAEARFVFGDNVLRRGYGGQAGAMRGEPNAIGVATKWAPGGSGPDFFEDDDPDALAVINADLDRVVTALAEGCTVYVPEDGLGTGLSELPTRAPNLHRHIRQRVQDLARRYG